MGKIKFSSLPDEIAYLAKKVLTGEKVVTSSLYDYYPSGLKKVSNVADYFSVVESSGK